MNNDIDLNDIANFMNSEVNEVDKSEVENTLSIIDQQLATVKTKDIATVEEVETKEHSIDELTEIALKTFNKVDVKSDDIYDLFYGNIAVGKDRSDASKEALVDSVRLKTEMINALAGLAQAKAKLEIAKAKMMGPQTGVYINNEIKPGSEFNISLSNLYKDSDDD